MINDGGGVPGWRARIVERLAVPMMHFHNFHVNVAISLNCIPQIPLIGSIIGVQSTTSKGRHLESIPPPGKMCPTVIDKSQPIESMGSRLRDRARTSESKIRVWSRSLDPIDSIGWLLP